MSNDTTKFYRDKLKEVDRRLCDILHFIRGMSARTMGPNPLLDEIPDVAETNATKNEKATGSLSVRGGL